MSNKPSKNEYQIQERGNRLNPHRFHRRYWHLVMLREKLKQIVDSNLLQAGDKLLDYGCSNKPYESLFKIKFRQYIGADLPGNEFAEIIVSSQGKLPIEEESVDCVLSTQVLEHVEDPCIYLSEAYRVLKQGGSLIISTHGIWQYHPDPNDYWRWTIDGLQLEITSAGFDIIMWQSIFGMTSTALQLWQDGTYMQIPGVLRPIYIWLIQRIIKIIENRNPDKLSDNASVYIVFAKKIDDSSNKNVT